MCVLKRYRVAIKIGRIAFLEGPHGTDHFSHRSHRRNPIPEFHYRSVTCPNRDLCSPTRHLVQCRHRVVINGGMTGIRMITVGTKEKTFRVIGNDPQISEHITRVQRGITHP